MLVREASRFYAFFSGNTHKTSLIFMNAHKLIAEPMTEIEKLDARLLSILQNNNRHGTEALGKPVSLSATAVQRRLKYRRDPGVIEANVSISAPQVRRPTGGHVRAGHIGEGAGDIVDRFKPSIRQTPEVMNGYYVAGESDLLLIVTAAAWKTMKPPLGSSFMKTPTSKVSKPWSSWTGPRLFFRAHRCR
jgi:Lrp/AsnC family leucine-responsive transcriptional regulator